MEVASQTAVGTYARSELLKHNMMPSLIEATRRYIRYFEAGVNNPQLKFRDYVVDVRLDEFAEYEGSAIDKVINVSEAGYPNEEERKLMKKLGREAFLTGRAIANLKKDYNIHPFTLGVGTFTLLDGDSKNRVAENVKALMEAANAKGKGMGGLVDTFLAQNTPAPEPKPA